MGNLYIVGTPIGNLKDISFRAIETLKEVDIILCEDTRTSQKLLNHYDIKNKLVSYHKFNEFDRTHSIITDLKNGKNIALITDAGMPCISDPGYILVKNARENNINVYGIGGISAFVTGLSISGINSDCFTFYGFFPRENKDKKDLIKKIDDSFVKTYIFYESPKRIIKTLEFIRDNISIDKISVSKELTKLNEKTFYGDIDSVIEKIKSDDKSGLGEYMFSFSKRDTLKNSDDISIESLLVDLMIKKNVGLKDAVNMLNDSSDYHKKDIYNASLNLKNIINNGRVL